VAGVHSGGVMCMVVVFAGGNAWQESDNVAVVSVIRVSDVSG
jgi:hypothetical protein